MCFFAVDSYKQIIMAMVTCLPAMNTCHLWWVCIKLFCVGHNYRKICNYTGVLACLMHGTPNEITGPISWEIAQLLARNQVQHAYGNLCRANIPRWPDLWKRVFHTHPVYQLWQFINWKQPLPCNLKVMNTDIG